MLKFRLIFLLLLLSDLSFSQSGIPFIKNYYPEEYQAEGQIWTAVQDKNGIMYFGSNNGILMFDGNNFRTITLPKKDPVRSMCVNKKGIIYVGSVGEFGYIDYSIKDLKYTSLSADSITGKFSDVWTTVCSGNNIWFASNESLFRYNPEKIPSLKKIDIGTPPFLLYKSGEKIFVTFRGKGTFMINNDELTPLKNLNNVHPWFIVPYKNNYHIIGDLEGLRIINPETQDIDQVFVTKKFFKKEDLIKTNSFFEQNQLYLGAVSLGNGKFAFGTLRNGVVIINKSGKITKIINEDTGLINNSVQYLYKDKNNELWACTAYGISRISVNSPFETFDKKQGIKGSIYDVLRYGDKFFLTSNLGLYYYHQNHFEGIEKLSGKNALQILSPLIFNTDNDSIFLVNTIYGMYRIDNLQAKRINNLNYNSALQSGYYKNTIYLTKDYDLYKMNYENKSFTSPKKIAEFNDFIFIGCEIDNENLFLTRNDSAVIYNIHTKQSRTLKSDIKINEIDKIDSLIFAYSDTGLYFYNPDEKQFKKDSIFTNCLSENFEPIQFEKINQNNFWLSAKDLKTNKTFIARLYKSENGLFHCEITPYKIMKNIKVFHKDGDSILWAINSKTLYKYQLHNSKNFKQKETCLIRKVKLKNDSILFAGIISNLNPQTENLYNPEIHYSDNNIFFEVALSSFDGEKNEFSYKLENGKKNDWSEWSKTNFKEYTNLFEGEYTFSVKGRNIYDIESKPVTFKFTILPPWYRTYYAYLTYLILLTLFIWFLIKLNAERLKKENIRLDNIVKERTAEILTQKEEIQAQADYLEEVNQQLKQKNEEISTIAENLKEANFQIKEKNKYIFDSINYAKKIQQAALPSVKDIAEFIPEFFIINKPKDIVSGDFYFVKKKGDYLITAVADCTGHGVPGGFLSMMGMAVLSDVVQDNNINNPAEALEKMRKIIKRSLHQTQNIESRNEGIEIALCVINTKDLTMEYAGANHPLFIAREENGDRKIIQIPADMQPVGIHYKEKPFELKKMQLLENDMIYMFSDGYFDQFGGKNKKKFLLKNLIDLLQKLSGESIKIQKREILNTFNQWKADNTQVDDVLMFGIRIKNL